MVGNKKILIVEDDPDSRAAICTIVEALGYDVVSFPGGKEALAGLDGVRIDLALLDIMMPGMDGYELLRELRKRPEFAKTPMVMVTARDENTEVLEGYKYGADYYICKPFTAKQLEWGIKLHLEPQLAAPREES